MLNNTEMTMADETTDGACEIKECGHAATSIMNGIHVCERCRIGFVSVGFGAVYFDGRWHGVSGAPTADAAAQG
ncbi:hypothetical protein [Mycobacterium sp.]|uniref:hypothetical protein n=1 Tax=Mycobacterium sp. TaxID=1785 RepID=UPI0026166769|nr:hypothetical protein [Mycobacterium sp.]